MLQSVIHEMLYMKHPTSLKILQGVFLCSNLYVTSPEAGAEDFSEMTDEDAKQMDTVLNKFLKTMQTTATRLQEKLLKPEVRQKGKEQVKEKARDSVLQLLSRLQAEQVQRKPEDMPIAEKSENRFQ